MLLIHYLEEYVSCRDLSADYIDQLRWHIKVFEKCIGRAICIEEMNADLVNAHLRRLKEKGRSSETRRGRRRSLLAIWRDAAERGLVAPPNRIMRIGARDKTPRAWSVQEVQQLASAACLLRGHYQNRICKADYWRAYVLAGWDMGLRGCDMRRIEFAQVTRTMTIIQHKTGKRKLLRLRPASLAAIKAIDTPARRLVWPLWGRIECWRREAKRLVKLAGLTGSIGMMRHSTGTAVEIEHPGHGHLHLGNTRAVFEANYLDLTLVQPTCPLPPPLEE